MSDKFKKIIHMGSKSNVDAMQFESDIVKILVAITFDDRSHLDYRIARIKTADNSYYQLQIFDKTKKHFETKLFPLTSDVNESFDAKMDKYYALRDICRHYRNRGLISMPDEMFDDRMILGSSFDYVTSVIGAGDRLKIDEIIRNVETKIIQINTFRKLVNLYDLSARDNSSLAGVLSSLVASLNYFLYGDNENKLLNNCVMSSSQDAHIKCKDIENINKFSVFSRCFSHGLSDMFCQVSPKQAKESDFLCEYYRKVFDGFVFPSSVINKDDLLLMPQEDVM